MGGVGATVYFSNAIAVLCAGNDAVKKAKCMRQSGGGGEIWWSRKNLKEQAGQIRISPRRLRYRVSCDVQFLWPLRIRPLVVNHQGAIFSKKSRPRFEAAVNRRQDASIRRLRLRALGEKYQKADYWSKQKGNEKISPKTEFPIAAKIADQSGD